MRKELKFKRYSDFFQKVIRLDDGKPLDFNNYKITKMLLDIPTVNTVVLRTARQVGKSVNLALMLVKYSLIPFFRSMVIHPSERQMKEFSMLKFGAILTNSNILKDLLLNKNSVIKPANLLDPQIINNVKLKSFVNGSIIRFNYAADSEGVSRIRGGSADLLLLDEAQDIDLPNIMPILLPTLESSDYGYTMYCGTPLGEDDPLGQMYETTTQHTMVVKCDSCNTYNTLDSYEQITPEGVVCKKCGAKLNVRNGIFVPMNPEAKYLGIHINRLMFPSTTENPMKMYRIYSLFHAPQADIPKLIQEYLGVPASKASEILTKEDVMNCLRKTRFEYDVNNFDTVIKNIKHIKEIYIGIDWGGATTGLGKHAMEKVGASHTAIVILVKSGIKDTMTFTQVYHKLYPLINPNDVLEDIKAKLYRLAINGGHVLRVGVDALGGSFAVGNLVNWVNKLKLKNIFINAFQFSESSKFMKINEHADRIMLNKTRIINLIFNLIKDQQYLIPMFKKEEQLEELIDNFLAVAEYETHTGRRIWRKKPGRVDDLLMAATLAVASWYFLKEIDNRIV